MLRGKKRKGLYITPGLDLEYSYKGRHIILISCFYLIDFFLGDVCAFLLVFFFRKGYDYDGTVLSKCLTVVLV
jgi:hypothetical protein